MATVTQCDRCKNISSFKERLYIEICNDSECLDYKDLCPQCYDDLLNFLNTGDDNNDTK